MSEPQSMNRSSLARLAAVLRPAFRCPTTPKAVHDLYGEVVDAAAGHSALDASEAALRAVIMLRNAIDCTAQAGVTMLRPGATIDIDDADPDIGLYLALFGVETMLDHLGWRAPDAA